MKAKDKELINAILVILASDPEMKAKITGYLEILGVTMPTYRITAEEFYEWLSKVEVK